MVASEKGFQRLMEALKFLNQMGTSSPNNSEQTFNIEAWEKKCYAALTDDFNSPILIAHLFEAVNFIFKLKDGKETIAEVDLQKLKTLMNDFIFEVLGLENIEENNNEKLNQTLEVLIDLRNQARKSKNFDLSDQIRDRLLEEGIESVSYTHLDVYKRQHLTDDGDVENDRFVKQSRLEKLEPMEIVQKYTVAFHKVLNQFNLLPPTIEPTATGHILEQIELTQKLIDTGFCLLYTSRCV